jgi:AcrR family transcriptional regulator
MSIPRRRIPQQDRGERRVAEVLEAASAVISEVGYEAATMTEIADKAGSSIGALYQYFPNKDAIGVALRQQCGDELKERLVPLSALGSNLEIKDFVGQLLDVLVRFIEDRPAYIPLHDVPRIQKKDPVARYRFREQFAVLFREKQPRLTQEEASRIANVMFQVLKGLSPLYGEAQEGDRKEVVNEFKLLLTSYLSARLNA